MEPLDPRQAAAVWKRVLADGAEPEACLQAAEVLQMRQEAVQDRWNYCALARCVHSKHMRRQLNVLADEQAGRIRALSTVYYLMTGTRPKPQRATPARIPGLCEGLRQQWSREQTAAGIYRAAAKRAGAHAQTFTALAYACEQRARKLHVLLACGL